jgi:hypothetical protein
LNRICENSQSGRFAWHRSTEHHAYISWRRDLCQLLGSQKTITSYPIVSCLVTICRCTPWHYENGSDLDICFILTVSFRKESYLSVLFWSFWKASKFSIFTSASRAAQPGDIVQRALQRIGCRRWKFLLAPGLPRALFLKFQKFKYKSFKKIPR